MTRRMHASLKPLPVSVLKSCAGCTSRSVPVIAVRGDAAAPLPNSSFQWRALVMRRYTLDSTNCNMNGRQGG